MKVRKRTASQGPVKNKAKNSASRARICSVRAGCGGTMTAAGAGCAAAAAARRKIGGMCWLLLYC
jgi:hypothetical protein